MRAFFSNFKKMNTTTATVMSIATTTTMSITDELYAYFKNPIAVIRFYQIAYSFTILFGLLGNTASLFTFSRPTLRKVSTGCLFIVLACSDMLYLLVCIFDVLEFGIGVRNIYFLEIKTFFILLSVDPILSSFSIRTTLSIPGIYKKCCSINIIMDISDRFC